MMKQITKAKFIERMENGILEWPPFRMNNKLYSRQVATEDEDDELVWCNE